MVFTLLKENRQLAADVITANRIHWIQEVRTLLGEFACEYVKKEQKDNQRLFEIKTKIELFMRRNDSAYAKLLDCMEICIKETYSDDYYEMLMCCSTYVLSRVWRRIMIEGKGKVLKSNTEIVELVDKSTESLLDEIKKKEQKLKSKI